MRALGLQGHNVREYTVRRWRFVCVCRWFFCYVLLLCLSVVKKPWGFFVADPFFLDAPIDVCSRFPDPSLSSIQEVSLLSCRSPLRFDRRVDFCAVLFDALEISLWKLEAL